MDAEAQGALKAVLKWHISNEVDLTIANQVALTQAAIANQEKVNWITYRSCFCSSWNCLLFSLISRNSIRTKCWIAAYSSTDFQYFIFRIVKQIWHRSFVILFIELVSIKWMITRVFQSSVLKIVSTASYFRKTDSLIEPSYHSFLRFSSKYSAVDWENFKALFHYFEI